MEEGRNSALELRDQVDRLERARENDLTTLRQLEAELRTQNDSFQKQGQPLLPCTCVHAYTRARAHTHTHDQKERFVRGNIEAQWQAAEDWKAVSSSFEEQLAQWKRQSSEVSQHLITLWARRLAFDQPVIIFIPTGQSS